MSAVASAPLSVVTAACRHACAITGWCTSYQRKRSSTTSVRPRRHASTSTLRQVRARSDSVSGPLSTRRPPQKTASMPGNQSVAVGASRSITSANSRTTCRAGAVASIEATSPRWGSVGITAGPAHVDPSVGVVVVACLEMFPCCWTASAIDAPRPSTHACVAPG